MHKTVSVVQKTFNILAAELCDWSQWSGHRAIIGGHLTISFVCFWSWYLGTVAREDKKLTWNYVQRDKWSPAWVGWARARQARDPAHCHCTCPVSTLFGHANYEKGDQKCIILQPSDFLLLFFRFVDHDIHLQSLSNRSPFTLIRKYALISQRCLQNH